MIGRQRLKIKPNNSHNVNSFICFHSVAHMALLNIVLVPVGMLDGTRSHAVIQQASANCRKGANPYNSPVFNKT